MAVAVKTEGTGLAHNAAFSSKGSPERYIGFKVLYRKGQALFAPGNILLVVAGFLLGRAALFSEMAPFGAVFWLLALREKPLPSYLVAVAVFAGRATGYGLPAALHLLGAMAVIWLLEGACLRLWQRRSPLVLTSAVLVLLSRYPSPVGSFSSPELLILLLEAVMGGLAAVVMRPGVRIIDRLPRSRDRPVRKQEELMGLALLLVLSLMGLKGLNLAGLSVEAVANQLLLLLSAYLLGAGWGAAMGIITGTILGLGNPHFYLITGSLSFSGFWTGLLRTFGRWGSAAGFLFSFPLLYLLAQGEEAGLYWREGLLSLAIFLAVPKTLLDWLSLQLRRVGLGTLQGEREKPARVIAARVRHFAKLFQELALGFNQLSAAQQGSSREDDELYPLLEDLMNRVCRACLFRRRCWEKEIHSHHRLILDLLSQAEEEGGIGMAHLPPAFQERCQQPELLVRGINTLKEVWQVNRFWERRLRDSRELVSSQLQGLSRVLFDLAQELERNGLFPAYSEEAPLYQLELGFAQKAGQNQDVCGDSYSFLELAPGVQGIILSDGMGKGSSAEEESKATVEMLKRLLEAGFQTDVVLRSVNSLLQLRSGEETFATVDMAKIDLGEGQLELLKIGAAPSYVKRGKEVFKLGASSLPLGILSQLEVESHSKKLFPGDLLVMVTDGAGDMDGDTTWLLSYLRRMESRSPQVLADGIVREALRRNNGVLRDDLTVAVGRVSYRAGNGDEQP